MTDFIRNIDSLVAFWDFQNDSLESFGKDPVRLEAVGEPLEYAEEGVFGTRSLRFRLKDVNLARNFLRARAADAPQLNIGGKDARLTVVAWFKREPSTYNSCEFVAGVWNEHGRRQYGMFINLKIWDSAQQLGAHISSHGGATPGYPYCMDVAIGATPIPLGEWGSAGFTYDGTEARSYLNGVLDVREPQGEPGRNPFHYPGGLLKGDADFTVGAVERPATVRTLADGSFEEVGALIANPFIGLLGGLAVFSGALSAEQMRELHERVIR